ncbi:MAG: hypothetical protein U0232_05790 [Thermomicrobiales bacterium]
MSANVDVLIRGTRVVDGTGNPWVYGDVLISGDRVLGVAPAGSVAAENAREGGGGGRDGRLPRLHRYSEPFDRAADDGWALPVEDHAGGDDRDHGRVWTPAPFGRRIAEPDDSMLGRMPQEWQMQAREWSRFRDWLEAFIASGVSPNVGSFLGGGTLRRYAKAMEMTPASSDNWRRCGG